ncbi:putative C-_U-editing enzyme APOBEC-4 [Carcharodon carcharias]|uniref:putative C->U-editing enzyme APOBEC-4 n=1 Tax=Carcharodon carcharias TaxID=13397 RepID=UPI001B7EABC5|nr:putative C->U-editing enzyme APOBEC-4 [Carcharodon carcharias]
MTTVYEEYIAPQGTLVKPYYWLYFTKSCPKCPYHIKTGEEARVSYIEFYETFGFPYAQPQSGRHLVFYELKLSSGTLVQKGQVTNCTLYHLHPESIFFDVDGYLDTLLYSYENIAYITIYSNYTPCNERTHYCINKIYDFLVNYPSTRLDIYFSELYHTDDHYSESGWNREALHSLASLWPRVTLNPINSAMWLTILHRFVNGVPRTTLYNPVLPERAFADMNNAHQIAAITGVNPSYIDVAPQAKQYQKQYFKPKDVDLYPISQAPPPVMNRMTLMVPPQLYQPYMNLPNKLAWPLYVHPLQQQNIQPKNVVRHLNMPNTSRWKPPATPSLHNIELTETVEILEVPLKKRANNSKQQRKTGKSEKSTRRD